MADDREISDHQLKTWLEERIVRLSLSCYELEQLKERMDALAHHADYLQSRGQPLPEVEQQQRETLSQAYLSKYEEVQRAFEPCASVPFSPQEELNIYCQTLIEVNERLKHQTVESPLQTLSLTPDEQKKMERYLNMAQDMKSYREYAVEMQRIDAQMQTYGRATKIRWQLQNQFDTYRVAQETYLEKMLAKYQVADLSAIQREMRAIEPWIEQAYKQTPHDPAVPTTIKRAYGVMQEEKTARAGTSEQEQHQDKRLPSDFDRKLEEATKRYYERHRHLREREDGREH